MRALQQQQFPDTFVPIAVGVGVFLFIMLVALPAYLLRKRRGDGGSFISLRWGSGEPGPVPPQSSQSSGAYATTTVRPDPPVSTSTPQPWDDRREELLRHLDVAERGLGRFYVVLLCVLMAAATGAMVYLYLRAPNDGNRDFLLLYGGVAYAIAMAWMMAQMFSVMRRISPPPDFFSGMRSRINVTFQSSPQVQVIDDAALSRAQQRLDSGGTLDEACAAIDPRYLSMNGAMQQIFRKAVEASLEQRRNR
jgi:hypothetical protein